MVKSGVGVQMAKAKLMKVLLLPGLLLLLALPAAAAAPVAKVLARTSKVPAADWVACCLLAPGTPLCINDGWESENNKLGIRTDSSSSSSTAAARQGSMASRSRHRRRGRSFRDLCAF